MQRTLEEVLALLLQRLRRLELRRLEQPDVVAVLRGAEQRVRASWSRIKFESIHDTVSLDNCATKYLFYLQALQMSPNDAPLN